MSSFVRKAWAVISAMAFILLLTPVGLRADDVIWAPQALSDLIDEGLEQNNEIQSLKTRWRV